MWHVLAGCVQADADTRQPDPHAQAKMMAVDPLPQHDATMVRRPTAAAAAATHTHTRGQLHTLSPHPFPLVLLRGPLSFPGTARAARLGACQERFFAVVAPRRRVRRVHLFPVARANACRSLPRGGPLARGAHCARWLAGWLAGWVAAGPFYIFANFVGKSQKSPRPTFF